MLFILPNAFTLSSIFCGLYAILHAASESGPDAFYQSAIAIFFAGFFDLFDGRVARMTKTQSAFGTELDSLADVISFGVAPAVVVYKWALWPLGSIGLMGMFFFTACGAIRLARFNVLAQTKDGGSGDFFVGLPIPLAASMIVALVIAHFNLFGSIPVQRHMTVLSVVILLGVLMVSKVPFWTFKNTQLTSKSATLGVLCMLLAWSVSWKFSPGVALLLAISIYVFAGLGRFVLRLGKL